MKRKMQKRPMTLLEVMIVIFIIGIIGSVVGYNMKGSLEKGKVFKTEHAMRQIEEILTLEMAKDRIEEKQMNEKQKIKEVLKESGLVRNPDEIMKDGWGKEFDITIVNGEVNVTSTNYENYKNKKIQK
jgi:prepilin-type N-terminal cleavage/methylation domain-containing protein